MIRIPVLVALSALFALGLWGDSVELKTGERIEGTFKQATVDRGIVIEVAGQPITIPLEKVKAIYFGTAPSASPTASTPTQEALDALRALRSVTENGISRRDYTPRLLDTKVKVDRYLASAAKDPARNAMALTMRFYQLASEAWEESVSAVHAGEVIVGDPVLSACAALNKAGPLIQSRTPLPAEEKLKNPVLVGIFVGTHPQVLWACASEQLAEAERLLAPR